MGVAPDGRGMPPDDPDAGPPRCSRRRLLRTGGGAAAALSASSAGCIATLPPLGRRVRFGRVDAPEAGPPTDRRWLPDPSAFRDPEFAERSDDVVGPIAFSPGGLGGDVVGERFDLFAGHVASRLEYVGVDWADVDRAVWFGPAFVVAADVDRAAVRDALDGTGYEAAGIRRGWDLYGRDDLPRALAVGNEGYVVVPWQEDLAEPLDAGLADARAVVDAATGAASRFHEANETFRRLSAAVGTSPLTWYTGGAERDQVAGASSYRFDESAVYFVWHRLYPESETPSKAEIQRDLEERHYLQGMDPREAMDVDVEVDGRVATIEQRQSHRRFREQYHETQRPPLTTWGVDHDRGARTMTLRLEAGASVPAEELRVDYHPAGPSATPESQFADRYDAVAPGVALTVDVSDRPVHDSDPQPALVLTWDPDEPRSAVFLLQYRFDVPPSGRAVQAPAGRGGDRE